LRESSGRVFYQQRPLLISAAGVAEVGSIRCVPVFMRELPPTKGGRYFATLAG